MPKKYGKTSNQEETQLYDKVTKLQTQIISELQSLNKKKNEKFDCIHCFEEIPLHFDPKINYFQQFWKSYMMNLVCIKRYHNYRESIKKKTKKIEKIESLYLQRKKIMEPIESKNRKRNGNQDLIEFECPECGKKYKDEQSRNIHLSIKHRTDEIKLQDKLKQVDDYVMVGRDSERNYYEEEE